MDYSFNLIDQPWIPCVPLGGGPIVEVGIRDALLKGDRYQEIFSESPLVTASLHRLLLAVLYAACGPQSIRESRALISEGMPVEQVGDYLRRWHGRFDLFDEEHPFYQTPHLTMEKTSSLSRLATELAAGNNATLFDHTTEDSPPFYYPQEAAQLLIAAQSFALGFGRSGRAAIGDEGIMPPYSADAPLLRGVTVWLQGGSLAETLLLNLVPRRHATDDIPCWEMDAPWTLRDTEISGRRQRYPPRGVVDQFTWQSRLIRLLPETADGDCVVRNIYFTQGRSLEKDGQTDEPMKAFARNTEEGFAPLALSASKAVWRDAHSIFAMDRHVFKRPEAFDHTAELIETGCVDARLLCTVNVVGLATAPNKAGKFLLWRHERFPTPAGLLKDNDLVERLGYALNCAEKVGRQLNDAVRHMSRLFLSPGDTPPDPKDVTNLADDIDPRRAYWSRLEEEFYALLRDLPQDKERATNEWMAGVKAEADRAFRESADQLGQSPRAIRARAQVYANFDPEAEDRTDGKRAKQSRKEVTV